LWDVETARVLVRSKNSRITAADTNQFLVFPGALKIERDARATASAIAALAHAHGLSGHDAACIDGAFPDDSTDRLKYPVTTV